MSQDTKTSSLIPAQTQAADSEAPVFRWGDKSITLFRHNDAWVCTARELGRMLDYADDGRRLVTKITGAWKDDFIAGSDTYWSEIANEVHQVTGSVQPVKRPELLLTRDGINGVCLLSRKPIGVEIRQWLRREVMPQIAATGSYIPKPQARVLELRAFINAQQELWDRERTPRLENPLKRITPPGAHPDIESALMWVRCIKPLVFGI